jgi:hypothetical protein
MVKRGNGEGAIRRHKDSWYEGRYTVASGRQRSVYGKPRKETSRKHLAAQHDGHTDTRPTLHQLVSILSGIYGIGAYSVCRCVSSSGDIR